MKNAAFLILFIAMSAVAFGQEAEKTQDVSAMDLEDMLNMKITVASKTAVSTLEAPGIVALVTREDMQKSGARDLVDVLNLLVPGFTFGVDVEGQVGIGFRGLWCHEGKLLLMIDGQEANEGMFATTEFGNHYPVENIERIEIIRGAGSALYGGYAGMAVVNIITRGAEMNGIFVAGTYSQMDSAYSHRNVAIGAGKEFEDGGVSFTAVAGQGTRSDKDNVDYYQGSWPMKNNSDLDVVNANFGFHYKGFEARGIVDRYRTTMIDLWGENFTDRALVEKFDSYFFNAKYTFKIGDSFSLTPEIKYRRQKPWNLDVVEQEYTNNKHTAKTQFNLTASWDITPKANLLFGGEYFRDYIYQPENPGPYEEQFTSGEDSLGYSNYAAFGQLMWYTKWANLTVGGRLDHSERYGTSFVPRFGLTKTFGRYHVKVMAGQSFRTPGGILPNRIPPGAEMIKPEKATSFEVEFGVKFAKNWIWTINGYDVTFKKVIVYQADPETGIGSYYNSGKLGTRGIESEVKYCSEKISFMANYSYYRLSTCTVANYLVPADSAAYLGFPSQRFNAFASIQVTPRISINPSLSFYGTRYAYAYFDGMDDVLRKYDPTLIFNVNVRVRDFPVKGFTLDAGVRDLNDSDSLYLQPYKGGHAPLPAQERAFMVRLQYEWKFDSTK